jgi:hypothetical protein
MLDLAPETESRLRERAPREGVSVDELLTRLLPPLAPAPTTKASNLIRQWQAEDATDDEAELVKRDKERAELQAALDENRKQAGIRTLFSDTE